MGFEGLLRGTFLPSISLEMVDRICFKSSVESFLIISIKVAATGTSPFLGWNMVFVPQFQ